MQKKYKNVAVMCGGRSSEREVSLMSGKNCGEALEKAGYVVRFIDPADKGDLRSLIDNPPDAVFNTLHGNYGEDGLIQGFLETLNIPYTHSGVKSAAVAMDKSQTKKLVALNGVPVAPEEIISYAALKNGECGIDFPLVVKPAEEGSSVGVFILQNEAELQAALPALEPFHDVKLMAEKYIPGRELTVSVLDGKALAVTEITTTLDFYNYESKYTAGGSVHEIPARIPADVEDAVKRYAEIAHETLECRGVTRSDFRYNASDSGATIFLEINTQPGMTSLSLVPEQAQYAGISLETLVTRITEDASCRR